MQSNDEELANYPVWYLYLDGLSSIDKDLAKELVKFKGHNLNLTDDALRTHELVGKSYAVQSGGIF